MAQAARKVTAKDANERAAHVRLTVLELAEATSPRCRAPRGLARDCEGGPTVVWRSIGWSAGFWLTVCVGLAAVVAYQLSNSFPLAPTVTAAPPSAPPLELAERPALPRPPASDAQGLIAARPLFSEGRRPYVPPPVPVEEVAPAPIQPSLPLELAGTFLTETDRAALLLVSGESPTWLRKGQLIDGWRIEAIEQDRVQLSKGDQQQVLQLRDDIAVLKTTRPVGREVGRDNRLREVAAEPTYEDEETEDEETEE